MSWPGSGPHHSPALFKADACCDKRRLQPKASLPMTPDKRAQLYMVGAHMGAVATLLLIPARLLNWPDFVIGVCTGVLLVSVILVMRRRLRDEYVESLWQSGTTLSFVVTIIWFLFAPFGEGMMDGMMQADARQDFPGSDAALVAVAAFFIGFHVKWLRSRL
jgi:hypothetical protein